MVAKINNGTSIFGAIEYNQEKVDVGLARVITGNKMLVNMSGDPSLDLHLALISFENYLLANQKTGKPVVHISLNPDPKDQLSDEQYAQIATDYMEKMGFGQQPFIVYKHEDIDRHHLHIVTVRVDETGRKISDSYEKLRSMDACRELEQQYGLHPALKKDREFGDNYIRKVNYEQGDVKRQIANTMKSLTESYRFQSLGEYSALLASYNINMKHVKGEKFGREYNGIVYAAMNNNGDVTGNPFKSSLFGKTVGYEALVGLMKKNAEEFSEKDMVSKTKAIVTGAMRMAKNRDEFEKILESKNMNVVFRSNEQGRIYGVTFIDHENRVLLNGSRLGKEFSANVFHGLFNEGKSLQQMLPEKKVAQNHNPVDTFRDDETLPGKIHDTSTIEEVFGVFDMKPQGEDYEETAFARRIRKRKKNGKQI